MALPDMSTTSVLSQPRGARRWFLNSCGTVSPAPVSRIFPPNAKPALLYSSLADSQIRIVAGNDLLEVVHVVTPVAPKAVRVGVEVAGGERGLDADAAEEAAVREMVG